MFYCMREYSCNLTSVRIAEFARRIYTIYLRAAFEWRGVTFAHGSDSGQTLGRRVLGNVAGCTYTHPPDSKSCWKYKESTSLLPVREIQAVRIATL